MLGSSCTNPNPTSLHQAIESISIIAILINIPINTGTNSALLELLAWTISMI